MNKDRVGLIEEHVDHPGGVANVVGDAGSDAAPKPVEVAQTPRVRFALARNSIKQVPAPRKAAPRRRTAKKETKAQEEKPAE